jgi:hypothetical protein
VVAPENVRIGNLMLDHRLERPAAREMLLRLEATDRDDRKAKFGKTKSTADRFDLVLNAECLTSEQMVELIETAVISAGPPQAGAIWTGPAPQDHAPQENLRQPERGNFREPARLLPDRVGVRTSQLSNTIRSRGQSYRVFYTGFLFA